MSGAIFYEESWVSLVPQMVKNLPEMQDTQVQSLGWEDPLKKGNGYPLQYSGLELHHSEGIPGGSDNKKSACNAGDPGLITGSEKSPGEGNGNPLQYSCLENPMVRGVWRATVHGVTKNQTQLSN